jgi:outer membrane protein insertion porin family
VFWKSRLWRRALLCAAASLLVPAVAGAQAAPADFAAFEGRTVTGIKLDGNRVTREHVITRELETKAGQPFAFATLDADLQRLENLGLFAETRVVPEADGDGVRLTVTVREMPPILAFPSFIYTEENGFSYGGALSALNLTGRGISLSARAYFGGTTQRWARFSDPWITGNHVSFEFFGGKRDRADTLNGFEEDSWEFAPKLGTWLGRHGRLQGSLTLFQMKSDVDGKTLDADNDDHFRRVGATLGYDTRDSWRDPRRGWKNELEIVRSGGAGSFWTMNFDARRYQPTGRRQHVLLSTLLTLQSGTVGRNLPGYFTYYLGGANTIRGYSVEDLGPKLNGKNQLLTTAEYNFNLLPLARRDIFKWAYSIGVQLALFSDLGIAWSEPGDFAADRFRAGVGAGLRFLVPGSEQVRFDVGWSRAGGVHFHFASGTKPSNQRQRLR